MSGRLAAIGAWAMGAVLLVCPAAQAQEHVRLMPQMGAVARGGVKAVAFSSDGRFVLTGNFHHTAQLWDVATGLQLRSFAGTSEVESVAFSPNGRFVFTGGENFAFLWDAMTGRRIRSLGCCAATAVFSADGRLLLIGNHFLPARLWDVDSGQIIRSFGVRSSWSGPVAYSRDGSFVLTGDDDNIVRLWDAATGQQIRAFSGQTDNAKRDEVESVAFSPNGRYILTGGLDNTARLWDAANGKQIGFFGEIRPNPQGDAAGEIDFDLDGRFRGLFAGWAVGAHRGLCQYSAVVGCFHRPADSLL